MVIGNIHGPFCEESMSGLQEVTMTRILTTGLGLIFAHEVRVKFEPRNAAELKPNRRSGRVCHHYTGSK